MERQEASVGSTTRRRFVAGAVGLVAVSGCLGDEDAPDPIALDAGQSCEVCQMVIEEHPGPVGQAFYDDEGALPEGRDVDEPACFCSSTCTYEYVLDEADLGADPVVVYLTDYSTVDWEVYDEQGVEFITSHLEAEAFGDAEGLTLVAGSDALGAMGQSLIGFSETADAEAFADDHGGQLVDHDDVSRELIDGLV